KRRAVHGRQLCWLSVRHRYQLSDLAERQAGGGHSCRGAIRRKDPMESNGERESLYDHGLGRNAANYSPLTPLSFLERAASVFAEDTAIVQGSTRRSWRETYRRCRQLASALTRVGDSAG